MSILDVTEDQIFQTLGKGKDPNFKQIEKARPVTIKPKKMYTINSNAKNINSKTMPVVKPVPACRGSGSTSCHNCTCHTN